MITLIAFQPQNLIGHNTHAKVLLILNFKLLRYLIIFYYIFFTSNVVTNAMIFFKVSTVCQFIFINSPNFKVHPMSKYDFIFTKSLLLHFE